MTFLEPTNIRYWLQLIGEFSGVDREMGVPRGHQKGREYVQPCTGTTGVKIRPCVLFDGPRALVSTGTKQT